MADWDDEVRDALAVLNPGRAAASPAPPAQPAGEVPRIPNIISIYAWHPELIRGWMPFSNHLRHSTLSDRVRELAILRTTWLRRGEYEWAQHTRLARAAGLTDAELDAVGEGQGAATWEPLEAALLRAVDEMCEDRYISEPTWQELESYFDRKQLLDLVFTVGTYDMHCMAFNTFGLELDPGMQGFTDAD